MDFDLEKLLRSEDGIRMLTEGVLVIESYARMPFGDPAYRALYWQAIRARQTPIPLPLHRRQGPHGRGGGAHPQGARRFPGGYRRGFCCLTNACRTTGRGRVPRNAGAGGTARSAGAAGDGNRHRRTRRESIESALDAIAEKSPSFEEDTLRAEFEIGAAELEDIRARYLV